MLNTIRQDWRFLLAMLIGLPVSVYIGAAIGYIEMRWHLPLSVILEGLREVTFGL